MSEKLIVIDIGNTTIHAGVYDDGAISDHIRISYKKKFQAIRELETFSAWLDRNRSENNIAAISLCSVVPSFTEYLSSLYNDLEIFTVHSELPLGIGLEYDPKKSFGADRFANLVSLHKRYGCPGVVIDIGSALTCDLLDATGNFAGGMIFPGPGLCLKSLHDQTAQLPVIDLKDAQPTWGFSTKTSIQAGIYKGFYGMIRSLIDDAKKQLGSGTTHTVVTGGWASLLQPNLAEDVIIDADLTLKGIGDAFCLSAL